MGHHAATYRAPTDAEIVDRLVERRVGEGSIRKTLTEDDVRRIIREEIERVRKDVAGLGMGKPADEVKP